MEPNKKVAWMTVAGMLMASIISVLSGYNMGYKDGRSQGIELAVEYTIDTLQKIIDQSAKDDTVQTVCGNDTVIVVKTGGVTHLTMVSKDTVSYFLSKKTIKP